MLDPANGRPHIVYSVQIGSAGLPTGQGGTDMRYRYARWDGTAWRDHPLAYAGTRLYSGEDDYTGLAVLDPTDPSVVYISTNANPTTGAALTSTADGRRHWEIFRGDTTNAGDSWQWTPMTDELHARQPAADRRLRRRARGRCCCGCAGLTAPTPITSSRC